MPKVGAQTKRTFKSVSKDKLPEKVITELNTSHSRTPVFYGLPKDHKPFVTLRPVISGCEEPTEKVSSLLKRILKQFLKFVPTHLWNTQDFLNKIPSYSERSELTEGTIFLLAWMPSIYTAAFQ